ncbi:unnamed protein product [Plutella xylostella]|uniref:(diamondback moth) hypothetical protein n=1 Tax=Plutella xylostella TaxID=51655 RepID=A0A8S4E315_PLUXY|nr:unnamed protein product [Plutella xylostella]
MAYLPTTEYVVATGTLTEDGLAMWGCVPVSHATLPPCLSAPVRDPRALNDLHELKMAMACCHSLTKVEGELSGDPLDLEMFKATGWVLEEPDVPETANYDMLTPTVVRPSRNTNINVDDYHLPLEVDIILQNQFVSSLPLPYLPLEVGIILQNQFVSSLARASVATRTAGEDVVRVYCKGSPDSLHQYCKPETAASRYLPQIIRPTGWGATDTPFADTGSPDRRQNQFVSSLARASVKTVPANLNSVLSQYAEKGYRVIALASRVMEVTYKQLMKMTREEMECELTFLGLVILENKLKPATAAVIKELKDADIHVVMITGDNIHTAISVATECGILARGERVVRLSAQPPRTVRAHCTLHAPRAPCAPTARCTRSVHTCSPRRAPERTAPAHRARPLHAARGQYTHAARVVRLSAQPPRTVRAHCTLHAVTPAHRARPLHAARGQYTHAARVVRLSAQPPRTVRAHCTLHAVPIGKPSELRAASSVDSGLVSEWSGSASASGSGVGDTSRPPNYKVAMTGDTWKILREHYPSLVPRIIARGAVFARMTSEQKQQLIVEYQALGYYVGMCGDGANDCGALRAAHTGISLSELESSVAAPFTAADPDIVCVTRVLREGRAALTTSFGIFKFMVAASLTEFLSVALLYYFDSNLADFQFLFIDVALVVNFAALFGKTEAFRGKLCKIPPLTSLLGLVPLLSLFVQMALVAVGQYLSYYAISRFPWYNRHTFEGDEAYECYENYAIYVVSMFQYVILAIVFSHGSPYRRSVITNKQMMISVAIMTGICIYLTVAPAEWLARFMELKMPQDSLMCYIVLAIAAVNLALALFFERFVIQFMMEERQMIPRFLKERVVRKTPHLMIKRQLSDSDYLNCEDVISYEQETATVTDSSSSEKDR